MLIRNDELRSLLIKSGIYGIQLKLDTYRDSVSFEEEMKNDDVLFDLSLHNKYHEIMIKIEK